MLWKHSRDLVGEKEVSCDVDIFLLTFLHWILVKFAPERFIFDFH